MLQINVKYRVGKRTSCYSIDLMLIFERHFVISSSSTLFYDSNYTFYSVYLNNIDFFKNSWLNLPKSAWNQRKVQSCKENRYYYVDLETIFQKYLVICNDCNYAFNSVYLKNIDFLKKDQLNSHKNGWIQSKVPSCNESKFLFYQFTSMFFRKSFSFAMTVTKHGLDLHKNAWNHVKYRVAKKKSFFSIDLLLFSQIYLVISSGSNKVFNSVYKNNIDFLKNGRLNSHRNASNQRKVPSWNAKMLLFYWFTAKFL